MIEQTITIGGKDIPFKASAAIPRMYRARFKRDIFKDLANLESAVKKRNSTEFEIDDLEIFENLAYLMACHADHSVGEAINEWLDQFDMFSIYEILPQLLSLWGANMQTDVEAKKKLVNRKG